MARCLLMAERRGGDEGGEANGTAESLARVDAKDFQPLQRESAVCSARSMPYDHWTVITAAVTSNLWAEHHSASSFTAFDRGKGTSEGR